MGIIILKRETSIGVNKPKCVCYTNDGSHLEPKNVAVEKSDKIVRDSIHIFVQ